MARQTVEPNKSQLQFTGDIKYQPKAGDQDPKTGETLYPYLADVSENLVEAVNLAIKLKRPLLLEGEPGCGKTQLAKAVAYEFSQRYNDKVEWPYADWCVKSTEQARDGLYMYDAVRRLYDAQLASIDDAAKQRFIDSKHTDYIKWGALGNAFKESQNDRRTIVLIDEIDKADIDFPNDLLLELDEKRFVVRETGEEVRTKVGFEPIIFIASNAQRKLPDAFLRRCLYHYVEFPKKEDLRRIVQTRIGKEWSLKLTDKALDRFLKIRESMEEERGEFGKKISISELLDWFIALDLLPKSKREELLGKEKIPYASTLLKSREDLQLIVGDSGDGDEDEDDDD
ncbi:MoxR family ATPase [Microcoleus sp. A006_D1]|uniref:AAA family ATPase n=1 Tax=Microcoleus sp. A006_D1 TaxID=3055267 RepID=UPI002FD713BE